MEFKNKDAFELASIFVKHADIKDKTIFFQTFLDTYLAYEKWLESDSPSKDAEADKPRMNMK